MARRAVTALPAASPAPPAPRGRFSRGLQLLLRVACWITFQKQCIRKGARAAPHPAF